MNHQLLTALGQVGFYCLVVLFFALAVRGVWNLLLDVVINTLVYAPIRAFVLISRAIDESVTKIREAKENKVNDEPIVQTQTVKTESEQPVTPHVDPTAGIKSFKRAFRLMSVSSEDESQIKPAEPDYSTPTYLRWGMELGNSNVNANVVNHYIKRMRNPNIVPEEVIVEDYRDAFA